MTIYFEELLESPKIQIGSWLQNNSLSEITSRAESATYSIWNQTRCNLISPKPKSQSYSKWLVDNIIYSGYLVSLLDLYKRAVPESHRTAS